MSQPYLGEIRLVGFNFAPVNWSFCNGALLPISEYAALFDILGTIYGGDGVSTFALPNLGSRIALHQGTYQGTPFIIGETGGQETVSITLSNIPAHSHSILAVSAPGNLSSPAGALIAASGEDQFVPVAGAGSALGNAVGFAGTVSPSAHDNRQPYVTLNYIIALYGVFPSQA